MQLELKVTVESGEDMDMVRHSVAQLFALNGHSSEVPVASVAQVAASGTTFEAPSRREPEATAAVTRPTLAAVPETVEEEPAEAAEVVVSEPELKKYSVEQLRAAAEENGVSIYADKTANSGKKLSKAELIVRMLQELPGDDDDEPTAEADEDDIDLDEDDEDDDDEDDIDFDDDKTSADDEVEDTWVPEDDEDDSEAEDDEDDFDLS
jgi:hypothetical protein